MGDWDDSPFTWDDISHWLSLNHGQVCIYIYDCLYMFIYIYIYILSCFLFFFFFGAYHTSFRERYGWSLQIAVRFTQRRWTGLALFRSEGRGDVLGIGAEGRNVVRKERLLFVDQLFFETDWSDRRLRGQTVHCS